MNYALIKDNTVENTVLCESDSAAVELFPDYTVVNIEDMSAGIGWSYSKGEFTAPPLPAPTPSENLAKAHAEYDRVTLIITGLNERIEDDDYDGTTEDAINSELIEWTDYRKLLRAYIKAGDGKQPLPSFN